MGTGLVHIYTGEGKGKTTAAVGLAVRALGHGIKVLYLYFNKQPGLYGYNEIQNLKQLGNDPVYLPPAIPYRNKKKYFLK